MKAANPCFKVEDGINGEEIIIYYKSEERCHCLYNLECEI